MQGRTAATWYGVTIKRRKKHKRDIGKLFRENPNKKYIQAAVRRTSPHMTTEFHATPYERFLEIKSNLRKTKIIKQINAPIF